MKNYTSKIPASKTISDIERELVSIGARRIIKEYDSRGKIESIVFTYRFRDNDIPFLVPAKVDVTYKYLIQEKKKVTPTQQKTIFAQAERTAWKNVYDWIRAQVVLIQLEQIEFMQVFLPFAYDYDSSSTFYDNIKQKDFKLLISNDR